MILLGGVDHAAQEAHVAAEGFFEKCSEFVDHCWHELEGGDVMTWVAFVAILGAVVLVIGVLKGSITFSWGRSG